MDSGHIGTTVYVSEDCSLGQLMAEMGKKEETNYIEDAKKKLESNEMTKENVIEGLNGFMSLWGPEGARSRKFYLIPNFLKELQKKE